MPNSGTVENTSIGYERMAEAWPLIHDLKGGTLAMRAAGTIWLPQEPDEESPKYQVRLARSILYNAYSDTVKRLIAKPFSRAVQLRGELPALLQSMERNIDGYGTTLTEMAAEFFEAAIDYGVTHLLVDYPTTNQQFSLAEERQGKLRARFVHVKPPNLLAWRYEGSELVEVRIKETRIERDGFDENPVDYIRVITPSTWTLFREIKSGTWVVDAEGVNTLGKVPLVSYYTSKKGQLQGISPLIDLAWMNLAHWQSMSDQRNILRYVRAAILVASGFTEQELPTVTIGPNIFVRSTKTDAKITFTEHNGKAIEAGAKDLRELEERMEVLGLAPFMERTANSTATGKIINESKTTTDIQTWIRRLELFLLAGFEFAAEWSNVSLGTLAVDVFNDFGITQKQQTEISNLILMRKERQITHETFLAELKRRSFLSESLDIEEEMQGLEEETPDLLETLKNGLIGDEDDEDDEDDTTEDDE